MGLIFASVSPFLFFFRYFFAFPLPIPPFGALSPKPKNRAIASSRSVLFTPRRCEFDSLRQYKNKATRNKMSCRGILMREEPLAAEICVNPFLFNQLFPHFLKKSRKMAVYSLRNDFRRRRECVFLYLPCAKGTRECFSRRGRSGLDE